MSRYIFLSVKLLWILDEEAGLRLAIEEATSPVSDLSIPILILNPEGSRGWQKLGHPSLLPPPHRGRIAGELILRADDEAQGFWELNNSSGRYGLNCGRTEMQLNAAAERFVAEGVRIDIDFQGI
ncbi:hypothetical protein [Peteryoungia ipomoeae]|uniref:Uncharacterized protein n=1 Tax=Peteryoungia ipomoeae TaxID=1210932 RepID=A0A4S8NV80_9HYPH|nr:hypothetical protein [Peteryoungia ipomoeae]THV21517.1 hypothetical protein FAA97_16020 [Peteryoungia ipomoeae]